MVGKNIMQIKYSKHIESRISMREINYDLPKEIFNNAVEHFEDLETGHTIAVMKTIIYDKERDVMVLYR
jgi:hypothetical protein